MDSNLVAAPIVALERAIPRLLRQQLIVLRRSIERPRLHHDEHVLLRGRARLTRRWRDALRVASPETLLPWHRLGRGACPR